MDFPVQAVVAPVIRGGLEESLRLVGSLRAGEQVEIVSEIDSQIAALKFKEGERVKKGQVIIVLDDAKLKASLDEAKARLELATAELKRGQELLEKKTITEQEADRLLFQQRSADAAVRMTQEQFDDAVISAPFDGVLAEHDLSPGQIVSRGQKLVWLVQTSPLEVEFNVPERYVSQVAKQQKVQIESVAFPGRKFEGSVDYISPRLDEATRTALVKARLQNEDGLLKPGMYGTLNLIFRLRENVLTIPEAALSYQGDHVSVVVMNPVGKAEFRQVTTGLRLQEKAEITGGLEEGERVVVEGYQKMGPGTTVLIAPESERYGITPPPPPADTSNTAETSASAPAAH
jgi:membrane fusion protein (multidrug efflux system)